MIDSQMSAAEFVRSMSSASPDAVVAAAKKAGFKLDTTYVSKTRGLDKARAARWGTGKAKGAASAKGKKVGRKPVKPTAQPNAKSAVAKKTATQPAKAGKRSGDVSKADFIRTMPRASAAEVVAAAKRAGIKTNDNYVKWLRWSDGRRKGTPAKASLAKTAARGAKRAKAGKVKTTQAAFVRIPPKHVGADSKALQQAFVTSAFDLGLARAQELLDGLRSRLRSIAV